MIPNTKTPADDMLMTKAQGKNDKVKEMQKEQAVMS